MVEDRCSLCAMFAAILANLKRKDKQRKRFLLSVKKRKKEKEREREKKRKINLLKTRKLLKGRYIK